MLRTSRATTARCMSIRGAVVEPTVAVVDLSSASGSPRRSSRLACRSHGWGKRWTRSSSTTRHGSVEVVEHAGPADRCQLVGVADEHDPPAAGGRRAVRARRASGWGSCRLRRRAPSLRPGARSAAEAGGRGVRSRSLSTVSARHAGVSPAPRRRWRTVRRRTPVGRRWSKLFDGGTQASAVLPAPAGPTITTSAVGAATARAASCWARSSPAAVDVAGRPGSVEPFQRPGQRDIPLAARMRSWW